MTRSRAGNSALPPTVYDLNLPKIGWWPLLVLLLPLGLQGQENALRLSIAPLRIEYQVSPGGVQTDATRLSNDGTQTLRISATADNWTLTADGSPDFLPPGAPAPDDFSCADWITLNPREFDLDAKAVQLIRYTIQVPADARPGGYRAAIVMTTLPPRIELQPKERAIQTRLRVVTILYVKVGQPELVGSIKSLDLVPPPAGAGGDSQQSAWAVRASVENQGTMYFRATGKVKVLDPSGAEMDVFTIGNEVVLPRSTRTFLFNHPGDLTPGAYRLVSTLDIGKPALIESEKQVTIQALAPAGTEAIGGAEKEETATPAETVPTRPAEAVLGGLREAPAGAHAVAAAPKLAGPPPASQQPSPAVTASRAPLPPAPKSGIPPEPVRAPQPPPSVQPAHRGMWVFALVVVVAVGIGGWYIYLRATEPTAGAEDPGKN